MISDGVEQGDNTPYLAWSATSDVAPIAGYSTSISGAADCQIDTADNFMSLGPLPAGTTTFSVRAIDAAGNCGSPSSFDIVVSLPDPVFEDGFEEIP